jgi:hypothetical protein
VVGEWVLQNNDIVAFGGSAYVFRDTADDRDTRRSEPIGTGRMD